MKTAKTIRPISVISVKEHHVPLKAELLEAISRVIDHGEFILGKEVGKFEQAISQYAGTKYAVGVNSGTDALFLSMKAYGIGPGGEVITARNSFLASATTIVALGAKPVFVDVGPDMNINPGLIESRITKRTKAIISVHLTGKPAAMGPIMQLAKRHNFRVIEDAAQAIGAEYEGKKVGSIGDAGCFSLHPLKTLSACGDGGVVVTNDKYLYEQLCQLRNIGQRERGVAPIFGYNSRLDAMQAAILNVKMKYLDSWNEQRRANAAIYAQELKGLITLPVENPSEKSVYHTFIIRTPHRDALKDYLQKEGVTTAIHYLIPIHLQECFASYGFKPGDFPECERQSQMILSLPIHHGLNSDDIKHVSQLIKKFLSSK